MASQEQVDHEVELLQKWISENGITENGRTYVLYGKLFDETQDIFEALMGTLKAAKKKNVVTYAAPILLKGTHDKVEIVLVQK